MPEKGDKWRLGPTFSGQAEASQELIRSLDRRQDALRDACVLLELCKSEEIRYLPAYLPT